MRKQFKIYPLILLLGILMASCGEVKKGAEEISKPEKVVAVPVFNADSAFTFIQTQVDFGPRVPNTDGHRETAEYLIRKFREYGAAVTVQEFKSPTFDGNELELKNIIATYNPQMRKRILLAAHWDTRPFADKDDPEKWHKPIDGANDGGSGVGVVLEVARAFSEKGLPEVGVDIILFDGEDWGELDAKQENVPLPEGLYSWWCLGSQYWSLNKHKPNYSAYYGILLDMVGAKGSKFYMEGASMRYAPSVVEKVWDAAASLGYGNYFIKSKKPEITDDHIFVNELARIPMINIVHYDPQHGYFGDYHHTLSDNMDLISTEPLKAVGQTLLYVIYHE